MTTRRIALVGTLTGERLAVHTSGYPMDPEQMLPVADVILLVDEGQRGVMLFRYTAYGEFGGDTLHSTVTEAEDQAVSEYGVALMPWMEVPNDVADAHVFAWKYAQDQLNERG